MIKNIEGMKKNIEGQPGRKLVKETAKQLSHSTAWLEVRSLLPVFCLDL